MDSVECLVIGAGVVGLAVARSLARQGREVVILEAADAFGTETSSRNSEVIHAGIYYAKDSLKARFCVAGREALYAYCQQRGVEARRCGKLIVATDDSQIAELQALKAKAEANGVLDLRWLSADEAIALEPHLHCTGALLSPSTGIIDSHGLMLAYLGEAEAHGAMLALNSPILRGRALQGGGFEIETGGEAPMQLRCKLLVNAAGLLAQDVAARIEGLRAGSVPPSFYAKGNYFVLSGIKPPFSRLIYPVPEPGGLGTHVTIDLGGQMRFGPDVEWIERNADGSFAYAVDSTRGEKFYAAVRRYWPGLPDGAIQPGYSGIRPKLSRAGGKAEDFVIQGADQHNALGLVNLFGIESPGLTASLAIGEHVAQLLETV
ncbi:NAD(P)/FAD-dependent oxidoreductase [Ferrovibrio sp.]|uniref:NAD(P)/FAD-dependent oxidoreductase n=1 Tax=Ferrovibrio sp. TaxID=1917215 RepID=UPI0025C64EF8|nr:NAD(P)/FAD-dependent oxidoreductase [Ferrovibrio sp.]MBX3454559.1 NAD(P)/FAD-dependent oxidoreductase [Ferrovibrio sp.]